MTADGLSGAIKFATFEVSKTWIEKRTPAKYHPLTNFLCAAGAILACSILLVPGEVLKTRLQAGAVKSIGEAISTTLATDGIGGFFAGYYATLVRDLPYTIMELGLYENIKLAIRKFQNKNELSQGEELAAAAITGGITSFVTTPLDLIKTKLMMQSTSSIGEYSGVVDAFQSIYASGGIQALFVSSGARVAWLLPFTTIYLGVYELSKRKLLDFKKNQ
jgi:solute carrier family 25 S-adenosylmethionine transporter 26